MCADAAFQPCDAGSMLCLFGHAIFHADAADAILYAGPDADESLFRRGLQAGFLRVVQQVAERAYKIRVGNGQLRGERNMRLDGDAFLLCFIDAAEQERVHDGVFTSAQAGMKPVPRDEFAGIFCRFLRFAVFKQHLHGVHMVCDVVPQRADVFILRGQRSIMFFLALDLFRKLCVERFEPRPLRHAADGKIQPDVRCKADDDCHEAENGQLRSHHSVGGDVIQPHEEGLGKREGEVQQQLARAELVRIAVEQERAEPEEQAVDRKVNSIAAKLIHGGERHDGIDIPKRDFCDEKG